jgi:predicted DNA-binding transcriptional regulator AlpA
MQIKTCQQARDEGAVINDPLITRKQARENYFAGVSGRTLRRWEAEGKLPPPIRVSPRVQGWRKSILDGFLAAREGATA